MAADETEIANLALSLLGEDPVDDISDDVARARTMNLWFDHVRDAVLQDHPWDSVSARAELTVDGSAPDFGFSRQYPLPNDYLRLVQFNDGKTPYRIEGSMLLTDAGEARIRYVKSETDVTVFEPMLVSAIAARLALETVGKIVGHDSALLDRLEAMYKSKLQSGRGVDAMSGPQEVFEADTWTDARTQHWPDDEIYRAIDDS